MKSHLRRKACLLLWLSLSPFAVASDQPELVTFRVEDVAYRGTQCEGCDTVLTSEAGKSVGFVIPVGEILFTTMIVPRLEEGAVEIELEVTAAPKEQVLSEEPSSQSEQSKAPVESGKATLLGRDTITIAENTSKRLEIGELGFRLLYTAPKLLSIPDAATIKDDQGAEVHGSVVLAARILEDGNVKRVAIMHSDDERLNEAAQNVMLRAKFVPPTMDGKPYSLVVHHRIEF